ncbi:hypothetical protein KIW84_062582 [Lathyrus oleraceus]|uniref:Uncharacterized protein n=1 Tax=Pisum sativum TaxID=3888 RepID=A0A9D4W5K3_PEA|nr:hypothetical protein KIW84_062582 [Pisum sativum]
MLKLKNGVIETVPISEIKLSLRQSPVKLGVGFTSRDPKLQTLIYGLEFMMRPSNKNPGKKTTWKYRAPGRRKWMIVGNITRYPSVRVTDLVLKTPKFTVEVRELNVDISKNVGSKSSLFIGLHISHVLVHTGKPRDPSIQPLQPSSNDSLAVIFHALACRWLDLTAMALHPELQPKPHPITKANKAASSVHHGSINLQASSESCYGSAYDDNE